MKLLIMYHSGLATDARVIFKEYARRGIDLTVIVPNHAPDEKEFEYVALQFRAAFNFFKLFFVIKKVNPNIIHVFGEYSSISVFQAIVCRNILYWLTKHRIPIVCLTFANLPYVPFSLTFTSLTAFVRRLILRVFTVFTFYYHKNNVDGIIAISKESLQKERGVGAKAVGKVIFWGVNLGLFYPKNRDICRKVLAIPKEVRVVGYVGRVIREKGLEKLVRAVAGFNDYHLILVGNGNYESELKKLVVLLGIESRVHFYNSVNLGELVNYYNCMDVFVLPSQTIVNWAEQYGRVLVEAMACHLAVVGSSSGAIPSVLENYPKHIIFKEDSLPELINSIQKVQNLTFPISFNVKNFLHKFSVENFVAENIVFYKNLITK